MTFFFAVLGFELRAYTLSPFLVMGFFETGSDGTIFWGCLQTMILLIFAS
jgi:hypothetical protein